MENLIVFLPDLTLFFQPGRSGWDVLSQRVDQNPASGDRRFCFSDLLAQFIYMSPDVAWYTGS